LNKILDNLGCAPFLIGIAVFFVLGILAAGFIDIPFFIWFGFCLLTITIAFLRRRQGIIFSIFFLLFCAFLGALHLKNHLTLPQNHIGLLKARAINPVRICGIIDTDPAYGERKISFILKAQEIAVNNKSYNTQGKILVNVFVRGNFSYGDKLLLEGNLYKPFNYGNESNFSYRDYLRNQGIYSILAVRRENKIVPAAKGRGNFLSEKAFKMKYRFKDIFYQYLWPLNADVLSGIILGERKNFPEDLRQAFVQTGTTHIIAISGFNVGIVTFIILILLKAVGIRRKRRYLLAIPLLIIHMLAVGASSSVVRATIMAIILLIAYLTERQAHILNSLALAALTILGYNPLQIFDVGFQLSFVSVLGIVLLSPRLFQGVTSLARLHLEQKVIALLRPMISGFSVSLSAWLVTFGFIAYYFKIISPITILANLIIVPFTSLIIILGFTLGLSAIICPILAGQISAATNLIMALLFKITFGLSRLPFAYFYLSA
jgi:competence protein ComEC